MKAIFIKIVGGVMVVYGEIYFIENLILDFIIIKTTSKILQLKEDNKRVFTGAIIGSLYSMAFFFDRLQFLYNLPMKIIILGLIVGISFVFKTRREYIKILITFYLVNMFLCGSVYFIIYFTGIRHLTVSMLITTAYAFSLIFDYIYKEMKGINALKKCIQRVTVVIDNEEYDFMAFLDSGNLLKDPLSKSPVMIVEAQILQAILPKEMKNINYSQICFSDIEKYTKELQTKVLNRFRIIPYKVVGNEKGYLMGFKCDYIEIEKVRRSNIILGLSNFSQSDEYNAIINPNLI